MNAPSNIDREGRATLFRLNRSQAMRIPKHLAFPDTVREVVVRRSGDTLIVTPVARQWSDFFARLPVDADFALPADPPPADMIDPL